GLTGGTLRGVDAGPTGTKAGLFGLSGRRPGRAARRVPHSYPRPHHVERDQDELWEVTCAVIREAVAAAGARPEDIAAVAVTSHGDGVYLVDEHGRPTRPGILSLDTRAAGLVAEWERTGRSDAVLP